MRSSHEFRSVKAKVRVLCKQRRIRLEEFMKTFDVHHVKKIKVEQFKRALDVSGLQLSTDEMNVIINKYRFADSPAFVDYRRFCDLIDKAFTVKGLEAKPELRQSIHTSLPTASLGGMQSMTDKEQDVLSSAKEKLAVAIRDKGIVLKDVFHDFDRSNAGKVTKPQFVRDLLDFVSLSTGEVDALIKAYGTDLDVNYRALHYDITPVGPGKATFGGPIDSSESPMAKSPDRPRRLGAPPSPRSELNAVQELEAELSETLVRDRIRTKNFFIDFDPLRTEKCTEAQFRRCVKLCFPKVTEHDLDMLVRKYRAPDSDVSKVFYMKFCNYIEGKTNSPSSDNNCCDDVLSQLTTALRGSSVQPSCSRDVRGSLSEAELEIYRSTMERLSAFCTQRRVLVKPLFQDFDKGRREHITVEQFIRVMTMLKLTFNNTNEQRVLLKRYVSPHGERFVNYVTFCHDIESWGDNNSRPSSSSSTGGSARSSIASEILSPTRIHSETFETTAAATHTRSVPMLMRYIKQIIKRDRIRLEEYYRDFDKLRHGKITNAQFAAGLNASGLVISKEEMALLADEYALPDVDSSGKHLVFWRQFVDDVESVFTAKGLERVPNRDLSDLQTKGEQFGGTKIEKDLSADEERRVTQAVVHIRKAMDRQRLEIKAAFEDFDRAKHGAISSTKFDRVLSMFQLLPEASTARLLAIKFREQTSVGSTLTLSSLCDVNYRAFLQALDYVGNVLAAGNDPSTLILPGSVSYRQGVYAGGAANFEGMHRQTRDQNASLADVNVVLQELRRQLSAKRIRLKEFLVDGDKLRSGEITIAKFHTALNRSGCVLEAADVNTLTLHFQSSRHSDKVDWRAFLAAIGASGGESSEPEATAGDNIQTVDAKDHVAGILTKIRLDVNNRRLHMKPYFQDYDHNNVCRVTKFQFAAVLDMMRLVLTPAEVEALQRCFVVRQVPGRKPSTDVNYVDFIQAVDSDYS
ncbi:hypothetical protein P43SY_005944 [Pythium insidiosum]|uniref:EF-hand domain-containing protein n=1 Tax=Pythium insidiosum TaxID=114742 RepID=A0AAD5QCV4_PYTIN|nr:hypothetical protein P43SY_005944 [Pythium insidiosum]